MTATIILSAAVMIGAGLGALLYPSQFASMANFSYGEHFIHDAGAFQVGIGTSLLLALWWRDSLAVVFAAFLVSNTIHMTNHAVDLAIGGHPADPWVLGALSTLTALALFIRLQQLRADEPSRVVAELVPFVNQPAALLTTFRKDGQPVGAPLNIAVAGDRAYIRSWAAAWKTIRIRNNPVVLLAPSTTMGKPVGPAIRARARILTDPNEVRAAADRLARKHPILQGFLVPATHRLMRYNTVHIEVTPLGKEDALGGSDT